MDYRYNLIEKANRSLNIKMGGEGDYRAEDIDIEIVKNIINNDSEGNIELGSSEIHQINNKVNECTNAREPKSIILHKINKWFTNMDKK